MKTTNVILVVGATVLVGGGAYLFLKNKKKKDLLKLADLDKLGGTTTSETTTSGTTTGGTTQPQTTVVKPQDIIDKTKEDEAKSLATQIATLKTQRMALETQKASIPLSQIGWGRPFDTAFKNVSIRIMGLNKKISDLQLAIKKVGYKEVNGTAVKLVEVTTTKLV